MDGWRQVLEAVAATLRVTTLADPGPVFAALADPTRRSVLTRLAARRGGERDGAGAGAARHPAGGRPAPRRAGRRRPDPGAPARPGGAPRGAPRGADRGRAVDDDDRRGSGTTAWPRSPRSPRSRPPSRRPTVANAAFASYRQRRFRSVRGGSEHRLQGARHDLAPSPPPRARTPTPRRRPAPASGPRVLNRYSRAVGCGPSPRSAARTAVASTRHFAVCRSTITSKRAVVRPALVAEHRELRHLADVGEDDAVEALACRSRSRSGTGGTGRTSGSWRSTSLIDPLPPFSSSSATVGVMPSPM